TGGNRSTFGTTYGDVVRARRRTWRAATRTVSLVFPVRRIPPWSFGGTLSAICGYTTAWVGTSEPVLWGRRESSARRPCRSRARWSRRSKGNLRLKRTEAKPDEGGLFTHLPHEGAHEHGPGGSLPRPRRTPPQRNSVHPGREERRPADDRSRAPRGQGPYRVAERPGHRRRLPRTRTR